jgi:putative endopeptidase
MLQMVAALQQALKQDIETLAWMTATTRQQALAKLDAIADKIGYPESWRDYAGVEVRRDDLVGALASASAYESARTLAKIGQPVNRQEWSMSTPTVNAFYRAQLNDINFPAGILQPPFFDQALDDAVNFGAIGAVIGHEMTHGFDDRGRKFAGNGNLYDWWTPEDASAFEERAACFERQYGGYTAVDDVKLNGKLTLGENVADNGGLRIAFNALESTIAGKEVAPVDGFTPQQRVFLGWAQIWCQNQTDEMSRMLALTDPHSPGRYRVNGVMVNMPEFAEAFACKADAAMASKEPCRVW